MSIFSKTKDLEDQLSASATQIEELETQLTKTKGEAKSHAERVASLTDQLATAVKENEAHEANITQLTADLDASKEAQEDFEAKVEGAAQAKVAALGHSEPVTEPQGSAKSDEDIKAEYAALPAGAERMAFRAKHAHLFQS